MAEKTAAQKKAQKTYMEKFVRVELRMDGEKHAAVKASAEAAGISVNAYINRAIDESIAREAPEGLAAKIDDAVSRQQQSAAAGEVNIERDNGKA